MGGAESSSVSIHVRRFSGAPFLEPGRTRHAQQPFSSLRYAAFTASDPESDRKGNHLAFRSLWFLESGHISLFPGREIYPATFLPHDLSCGADDLTERMSRSQPHPQHINVHHTSLSKATANSHSLAERWTTAQSFV
ncbi:hypothetical protein B296_00044658 [Ensete ventricosum]|uniref:Uncharacterized protein n=1 Tax=Ensete ventricosum TaxID=4639 RepID=A0A426YHV3_ENSVE|nr:hypothetical protein B296_00044658 [Ensete ventricosum]